MVAEYLTIFAALVADQLNHTNWVAEFITWTADANVFLQLDGLVRHCNISAWRIYLHTPSWI